MSCRAPRVCAAVLLFLASGCLPSLFLTSVARPGSEQRVVAGSVDRVSAWLEAALAEDGVVVVEKRAGQKVHLVGTAKSGKMFALLLRPAGVKGSESTAIGAEWGGEPDERLWRAVVKALAEMEAASRTDAEDARDD